MFSFIWHLILCSIFVLQAGAVVSTSDLAKEAQKNISKVPEFAYIQKAAEEIGVKVYLFGGTAAAYAHYVRWYIELQNGAENHQPERFDFDYTNIYRGNQDLDLVVDGTEKQALKFQELLKSKYAHIVGDKNDWEVRLLRKQMGDKLPLLDNPDFQNQHTDTNSTGMLDLTATKNELAFRDLLDWENEESRFLKDVASARITYITNKNHQETQRFKEGRNPLIFSAVRYLAKLTQYEVTGTKRDLGIIKNIINSTDFSSLTPYVKKKLEEFAKKALLNSPNSEYAWNLMEKLGLREKLIKMDRSRIEEVESLSWWLNKEPLRSSPLGKKGRTARQIFGSKEIIVSHETNSFQAYENITRSSRGEANAFISRGGSTGELAVHGDGFYTKVGLEGARGTGLTIRFILNPRARENEDFTLRGNFVIVKNKKALTLIQENINIDLTDFLKLIKENNISEHDKGLQEKFLRKFKRVRTDSQEFKDAVNFVKSQFVITKDFPITYEFKSELNSYEQLVEAYTKEVHDFERLVGGALAGINKDFTLDMFDNEALLQEIVKRPFFQQYLIAFQTKNETMYPKIVEYIIDHGDFDTKLVRELLKLEKWQAYPHLVKKLILKDVKDIEKRAKLDQDIVTFILSNPYWKNHTDLIEIILERKTADQQIVTSILSKKEWTNRFDWLELIFKRRTADKEITSHIFSHSGWKIPRKLIYRMIDRSSADQSLIKYSLSKKHWKDHPEFIDSLIERISTHPYIIEYILTTDHFPLEKRTEWLENIMEFSNLKTNLALLKHLFSQPGYENHADWIESLIHSQALEQEAQKTIDAHIITNILNQPQNWPKSDEWINALFKSANLSNIINTLLSSEKWAHRSDLVERIINLNNLQYDQALIQSVFSQPYWQQHTHLMETLLEREHTHNYFIHSILPKEFSVAHAHWFKTIFDTKLKDPEKKMNQYKLIIHKVLTKAHWATHPEYVESLFENKNLHDQILRYLLIHPYWRDQSDWFEQLVESGEHDDTIISYVLAKEYNLDHRRLLEKYIAQGESDAAIASDILSRKHWYNEEWMKIILDRGAQDYVLVSRLFREEPRLLNRPEWLMVLIERDNKNVRLHISEMTFQNIKWPNHPAFKAYLGEKPVTVENLAAENEKRPFQDWIEKWREKNPPMCSFYLL